MGRFSQLQWRKPTDSAGAFRTRRRHRKFLGKTNDRLARSHEKIVCGTCLLQNICGNYPPANLPPAATRGRRRQIPFSSTYCFSAIVSWVI
jgi:hypothetical protein